MMSMTTALAQHRPQSTLNPLAEDDDRRSSSLSEIDDHEGREELEIIERTNDDDIEANDTEAETERLEGTPLKGRKYQNVIFTADNQLLSSHLSPQVDLLLKDQLPQTSDISSLDDSSEEEENNTSRTPSPRKRKRSTPAADSDNVQATSDPDLHGRSPPHVGFSPGSSSKDNRKASEEVLPPDNINDSETNVLSQTPSKKQKTKTIKRKTKRPVEEKDDSAIASADNQEDNGDAGDSGEAVDSNGEDVEIDEAGDADLDNASKNEEGLLRKKSALDSLTALEKCFATLRDKLFDERLTSANEELALLQQPGLQHPELTAMKEAVDQHRNQKIKYQRTFLKLKLQTLQKESVAAKHQIHSQYMQTVREIRDKSLEQINKEFYQVQRERRSCEGAIPDYIYAYSDKRSQQIAQQTAYNNEISVLSGITKYIGFPAAPMIRKARPEELEDDMRNMGIALQTPQDIQNRPHHMRGNFVSSLASATAFPRHTPQVEEHFLERNAWANPQHPAHHQQRQHTHRQLSQLSRASTPSTTPVGQKGVLDLTKPQGSASTLPEQPSRPDSSLVPTPATTEPTRAAPDSINGVLDNRMAKETSSRTASEAIMASREKQESPSLSASRLSASKSAQHFSPSVKQNLGRQDSRTPNTLPKPLPFTQTAPAQASPPVRLPVKVEDISQAARHSPTPHQFSSPAPPITAGSGEMR